MHVHILNAWLIYVNDICLYEGGGRAYRIPSRYPFCVNLDSLGPDEHYNKKEVRLEIVFAMLTPSCL